MIFLLEWEDVLKENSVVMKKIIYVEWFFFYYDCIFENIYIRSLIVKIIKIDSLNKGMIVFSIIIMIKKMNIFFLFFCFGGVVNFFFGFFVNYIFIL